MKPHLDITTGRVNTANQETNKGERNANQQMDEFTKVSYNPSREPKQHIIRYVYKHSINQPVSICSLYSALIAERPLLLLILNEVQVWPIRSAKQVQKKREGGTPPQVTDSRDRVFRWMKMLMAALKTHPQ